jgi:hypothetical protein
MVPIEWKSPTKPWLLGGVYIILSIPLPGAVKLHLATWKMGLSKEQKMYNDVE